MGVASRTPPPPLKFLNTGLERDSWSVLSIYSAHYFKRHRQNAPLYFFTTYTNTSTRESLSSASSLKYYLGV